MAGIEIVTVEWERMNGTVLADVQISGNWRKWIAEKMAMPLDDVDDPEFFDVGLLATSIPGVHIVGNSSFSLSGPNPSAFQILHGREESSFGDFPFRGPALVLGYSPSFGGRLLRFGGSQRVAVEAAAYGEWEMFRRARARITSS